MLICQIFFVDASNINGTIVVMSTFICFYFVVRYYLLPHQHLLFMILSKRRGVLIVDLVQFGSYIKELRKKRGLTLASLSALSGVSHPYLSQIENGKLKNFPSPEILIKISEPLDVRYEKLLKAAGHLDNEALHDYYEHDVKLYEMITKVLKALSTDGYFFEDVQIKIFETFSENMSFEPGLNEFNELYLEYLRYKEEDEWDYIDVDLEEDFIKYYNYNTVLRSFTAEFNASAFDWREETLNKLTELALERINSSESVEASKKELSLFLEQPNILYKTHKLSKQQIKLLESFLDTLIMDSQKSKKIALTLFDQGNSIEEISKIINESPETIQEWTIKENK